MPLDLPEAPRILITRTDRIGDLVLTTPLFKALREKFPKAWIAATVAGRGRPVSRTASM